MNLNRVPYSEFIKKIKVEKKNKLIKEFEIKAKEKNINVQKINIINT